MLIWINKKPLASDTFSEAMIYEKAKVLHTDLLKHYPRMSTKSDSFKASSGWFHNLRKEVAYII